MQKYFGENSGREWVNVGLWLERGNSYLWGEGKYTNQKNIRHASRKAVAGFYM